MGAVVKNIVCVGVYIYMIYGIYGHPSRPVLGILAMDT